ncbi:MAG: phosphotransferase enzyme family protein [Pirellulaceae bacterium]
MPLAEVVAQSVMAQYPSCLAPRNIVDLGSAGGFSGARFWRVITPSGAVCLRRWPSEHPTRERLAEIHAVLCYVRRCGLECVPAPLADRAGNTILSFSQSLWDVTPWLPGRADYHHEPTPEKLQAALATLARFHSSAATTPGQRGTHVVARGILERRRLLEDLVAHEEQQIRRALRGQCPSPLVDRARRMLPLFSRFAPRGAAMLEQAMIAVAVQPCIRDIWHDHVLYTGDDVTGIVDFGAMRMDSIAGDVARLLGSLVGDSADGWETGLEAYARVRPLSSEERRLVDAYDVTGVLLSGMNWLRWIYLEQRQFENIPIILNRLDRIIARLAHLAERFG